MTARDDSGSERIQLNPTGAGNGTLSLSLSRSLSLSSARLVLFCYFAPLVGAGGTKIEHRFALLSRAVNPFTAMLGKKRPIKEPNFTSLRPFFPLHMIT